MISAITLTPNDDLNIKRCLESIKWCDETIIYKAGTITNFSTTRNKAMNKTKGDWILFVDADEVVTRELSQEIIEKINSKVSANGYKIKRKDVFFGKELSFGETGNFYEIRLAKKGFGKWQRKVHEKWAINGSIGRLKNPLIHYSHPAIKSFLEKLNFYTNLDAAEFISQGKKFSFIETISKPSFKFFLNYFLRLGFLDGIAGFIMAFMMSLNSLVVRIKMYDLTRNS